MNAMMVPVGFFLDAATFSLEFMYLLPILISISNAIQHMENDDVHERWEVSTSWI